jgi:hypothetical protein
MAYVYNRTFLNDKKTPFKTRPVLKKPEKYRIVPVSACKSTVPHCSPPHRTDSPGNRREEIFPNRPENMGKAFFC